MRHRVFSNVFIVTSNVTGVTLNVTTVSSNVKGVTSNDRLVEETLYEHETICDGGKLMTSGLKEWSME